MIGADLRAVTGADVVVRSGGVLVEVRARRTDGAGARRTLRACPWCSGVGENGLHRGGCQPNRRNVTSPLIASLAGGADLPRLSLARLRPTWVARCAADIGLATFMAAAGVRCSQRLGDVVAHLDPGDKAQAVALLGGNAYPTR